MNALPPIHGYHKQAITWLDQMSLDSAEVPPRQSPVLSEDSFDEGPEELVGLWESGAQISWLGGPAAVDGAWPQNVDGDPCWHVATFHLGDAHAALGDPRERGWPSDVADLLPDHGYMQIFHDLTTYGMDAVDGERGGWLVSWSADDDPASRPALVAAPESSSAPDEAFQMGVFLPGWSIPCPLDLYGGEDARFERAEAAVSALDLAWLNQRMPGEKHRYPTPSTRLMGYSSTGEEAAVTEYLPNVLPLDQAGDEYVLLAEIESWTTLNGWFGDASSLEVWMRKSDLAARRFNCCWCIIRTD
ncbi:DUF1963 domain-containing protein [Micrococcus endophyticus]|uniref:DUF1963 domain-containing protein n=1 Tax=Micrococcus endophyticus TaxID=455343 RepID=UPI0034CE54D1